MIARKVPIKKIPKRIQKVVFQFKFYFIETKLHIFKHFLKKNFKDINSKKTFNSKFLNNDECSLNDEKSYSIINHKVIADTPEKKQPINNNKTESIFSSESESDNCSRISSMRENFLQTLNMKLVISNKEENVSKWNSNKTIEPDEPKNHFINATFVCSLIKPKLKVSVTYQNIIN